MAIVVSNNCNLKSGFAERYLNKLVLWRDKYVMNVDV